MTMAAITVYNSLKSKHRSIVLAVSASILCFLLLHSAVIALVPGDWKVIASSDPADSQFILGSGTQGLFIISNQDNPVPPAPAPAADAGSAMLRNLLRVLVAASIIIGVIIQTNKGVGMLISTIIGLIAFVIIDILIEGLL